MSRRLEQDLVDAICGSSVTPRSTDTLPGAVTANTTHQWCSLPPLVSRPDNEDCEISTQTVYRPREVRHLQLGLLAGLGLQFGICFLLDMYFAGVTFGSKDENGWDESRSVRNHIPYFSVRFCFLRDKRKQDQKRDGIHRDRDRKWLSVFPSVLPVSRFWPGYSRFHPVYTFTGTSAEGVEPSCAVSGRSARLASVLFGCMQNITLLVTRTCMYLTKKRVSYMYVYMYMLRKNMCQMSLFSMCYAWKLPTIKGLSTKRLSMDIHTCILASDVHANVSEKKCLKIILAWYVTLSQT